MLRALVLLREQNHSSISVLRATDTKSLRQGPRGTEMRSRSPIQAGSIATLLHPGHAAREGLSTLTLKDGHQ